MNRTIIAIVITFASLAALSGCAVRTVKYYDLDMPAESAAPPATTFPVALAVGHISTPHLFRDDRIVYRTGNQQMGTYEYHRWSEPPVEMLEEMLLQSLRNSGQYRGVERQGSNARGDLIVRGQLRALEEVDHAGSVAARVTIDLELFDLKTDSTVWNQSYSHDEPALSADVPAVVAALDRNVKTAIAQFTGEIGRYFASHPQR
jgi:ABC-type uncharacterized transport system auxiliary subunit